jgi:cell wall-associated NlpC family hydrolase
MADASSIVSEATGLIGKIPYQLGASVGQTASNVVADCSSFVQKVFSNNGIDLPRTADQQYKATMTGGGVTSELGGKYATGTTVAGGGSNGIISANVLKPGDLVFFGGWNDADNPPGYAGIQHVAIYAGNGNIVEEGSANQNVNAVPLSSFNGHIIAATRVDNVTTSQTGSTPQPQQSGGSIDPVGAVGNFITSGGVAGAVVGAVSSATGTDLNPVDAVTKSLSDGINAFTGVFLYAVIILIGIAIFIVGGMLLAGKDNVASAAKIGALAAT